MLPNLFASVVLPSVGNAELSPMIDVVTTGLVPNMTAPVPVSPVTAEAKFAVEGVPKNVATFAPKPDTPVEMGSPVALVRVPDDGVPNAGVVNDGDVAKTSAPD